MLTVHIFDLQWMGSGAIGRAGVGVTWSVTRDGSDATGRARDRCMAGSHATARRRTRRDARWRRASVSLAKTQSHRIRQKSISVLPAFIGIKSKPEKTFACNFDIYRVVV